MNKRILALLLSATITQVSAGYLSEAESKAMEEAKKAEAEKVYCNSTEELRRWAQFYPRCAVTYSVGDTGPAGGTVFHVVDKGIHGMEFAPVELDELPWGCENRKIHGTEQNALWNGWQNTEYLRHAGCSPMVKELDSINFGGYTDWFIGSRDEIAEFFKLVEPVDPSSNYLWSSSQHNQNEFYDFGVNAYVVKYNLPEEHFYANKATAFKSVPFRTF